MLMAILCLTVGIISGLARLGWTALSIPGIVHHGGIMTGGFLGTLIALEKVIPLKKNWLYLFPLLSASSVIFLLGGSGQIGFPLLILASGGLSLTFILYFMRERSLVYGLMTTGALCWTMGNVVLAVTGLYPAAVPWWMAFILFVISAERLELMKFLPVGNKQKMFFAVVLGTFLLSCLISFHGSGALAGGVALCVAAAWLLHFDLIGITLRKNGLTRFVAVALLGGYISLLLTGVFMITSKNGAFDYDNTVHVFFIGFVFSMIFAHGPIILPGVIGSSVKPYHPVLFLWLALLHFSWIARVAGGIFTRFDWRLASGIITALAIAGYFTTLATMTIRLLRSKTRPAFINDKNHDRITAGSLTLTAKKH